MEKKTKKAAVIDGDVNKSAKQKALEKKLDIEKSENNNKDTESK